MCDAGLALEAIVALLANYIGLAALLQIEVCGPCKQAELILCIFQEFAELWTTHFRHGPLGGLQISRPPLKFSQGGGTT